MLKDACAATFIIIFASLSPRRTECSLIFGNLTADDILLKEELDGLAAAYPGRFKVKTRDGVAGEASWGRGSGALGSWMGWRLPTPGASR